MRDLTLNDPTQERLVPHLAVTECLLARAAAAVCGRSADAEIVMLPDLGMPHNVTRVRGGFFTGALYRWTSDQPMVPVDATVNVDTVSVFRVQPFADSQEGFDARVAAARAALGRACHTPRARQYVWNLAVGNHFITYGFCAGSGGDIPAGYYLSLHSSASEFKYQDDGLYPRPGNWYWDAIRVVEEPSGPRYLRYIAGDTAEQFIKLAQSLESFNRERHQYIASLVAGEHNVLSPIVEIPHYGMPSANSVAIGCQWTVQGTHFPLLTGPGRPILILRSEAGDRNAVDLGSKRLLLHPHGLGKQSRPPLTLRWTGDGIDVNGRCYRQGESLEADPTLELRDFFAAQANSDVPPDIAAILRTCPATIVGRIDPVYSYARII